MSDAATMPSLMAEKIITRGDQLTSRAALNAERMRLYAADLAVLHQRVERLREARDVAYAREQLHDLREHLRQMSAFAVECEHFADLMYDALALAASAAKSAIPAEAPASELANV